MRRVLTVIATSVFLAAGAAPASAAINAECASKTNSYLFWPQGHQERPVAGFPAFPIPHLEVYRGKLTTKFPDNANDGYLDAQGNVGADKKCKRTKAGFAKGSVQSARTATAEGNVVCGFGVNVVHRIGKVSGGARLQTLRNGTPVVDATMKAAGSRIRYDSRYCTLKAAPG